jgi:penicillin-binding protein 1B
MARKTTKGRKPARRARRGQSPSSKSRTRAPSASGGRSILGQGLRRLVWLGLLAGLAWVAWEGLTVWREFEGRRWSLPARVYASPVELYAGRTMSPDELLAELGQHGYRAADGVSVREGTWWRQGRSVRIKTRGFRFWDGPAPSRIVQLDFDGGTIRRLRAGDGAELGILRLDPVEIGSVFPAHGEDRIVLKPHQIPDLLRAALIAVEDRRFLDHHGVRPAAIARAAWVNLKAGAVRQGGSTITQQLVKNYFLDNRRSVGRKAREAVMALWLDALYDKDEILTAYINEIYLGQDGERSIHGFGLAARFYFGRPLAELDLSELSLLVALVRGPSWYNPWRHPERAKERRDLVLSILGEQGVATAGEVTAAAARPLGLAAPGAGTGYYPAYMDLVRRQLAADYRPDDLDSVGLSVFTALEPAVQRRAGEAIKGGIEEIERERPQLEGLEGAVVVTRPQTGEVLAVVGGRRAGFDGFNRALMAARPIGSLVKPAVYLAAIDTGAYHLASVIEDAPVEVPLEDGSVWRPRNFSGEGEGPVILMRALAESLNLATVRLGMDVGLDRVVDTLRALGVEREIPPYPSLLLGALELTPVEVARVYGTLAGGGFRTPLRAVREIVDAEGRALERYGLAVTAAASPAGVSQINRALEVVMERGTGRSAARRLPGGLRTAGKTGTSNELRDSWFAGFSGDNLAVVWLGHDDGRPGGLTGATGALRVWTDLMREIGGRPFDPPSPPGMSALLVDYGTGELVTPGCGDPVAVSVPDDTRLAVRPGCGVRTRNLAERALDWLKRLGN